jgi:ABC-type dipeptide/oligopeptide/nickel transport system ATPase component
MLQVKNLRIHFLNAPEGKDAVCGVTFDVKDGEICGLVGESGSGKTVTALAISGLLERNRARTSGKVILDGKNLLRIPRSELRELQGSRITVVFQEPMVSMDPCMKIGPQVEECLLLHTDLSDEERKRRALQAMADADLPDPESVYEKYPHELSGGMLQRAMIASAIISEPELLICDEAVSALDLSIRAQVLYLLEDLKRKLGLSLLFITHDLGVVRHIADRILVMNRGKIIEEGPCGQVLKAPREEYTRYLISSVPKIGKPLT